MVYCAAMSIAAMFEVVKILHGIMAVTSFAQTILMTIMAIQCGAIGNHKGALVYATLAVFSLIAGCLEIGVYAKIAVAGEKGTVNIEVKKTGKNIGSESGTSTGKYQVGAYYTCSICGKTKTEAIPKKTETHHSRLRRAMW